MSRLTDLLDRLLGVPAQDQAPIPVPVRDAPRPQPRR